MHGLALSALLLAFGAIPVLPAFLGLWKNTESGLGRVLVRMTSLVLLYLCFNMSWCGAAVTVALWFTSDGLLVIPFVLCLQLPALWFSQRVAFGVDSVT